MWLAVDEFVSDTLSLTFNHANAHELLAGTGIRLYSMDEAAPERQP